MFPNGGSLLKPGFLSLVRDDKGKAVYKNKVEQKQVLDPRVPYLMPSMMREVLRTGTAAGVRARSSLNIPAAGAVPATAWRRPDKHHKRDRVGYGSRACGCCSSASGKHGPHDYRNPGRRPVIAGGNRAPCGTPGRTAAASRRCYRAVPETGAQETGEERHSPPHLWRVQIGLWRRLCLNKARSSPMFSRPSFFAFLA